MNQRLKFSLYYITNIEKMPTQEYRAKKYNFANFLEQKEMSISQLKVNLLNNDEKKIAEHLADLDTSMPRLSKIEVLAKAIGCDVCEIVKFYLEEK